MKLSLDLLKKAENEYSLTPAEIRRIKDRNATETARTLDSPEVLERRLNMVAAVAVENVADAFERYIGNNDLLPINYLWIGYLQSRSVGRIRYFDKTEAKPALATGFLISNDLLMTNHHVFPVTDAAGFHRFAEDATVEFNYEYDIDGQRPDPILFDLDPDRFIYTTSALDMAVIAVKPTDRTGAHKLSSQGYLVLNGNLGKAGMGDFATIIQHPQGNEKQIAVRKNDIISLERPDFLIYSSDTAPGSSGAPVFNDQWQVIALHSAGEAKKNAAGEYIDENGDVIELINGRIDGDRIVWLYNRGARASAMVQHLASPASGVAANPLIQALFSPAYTDSRPFSYLSRPTLEVQPVPTVVVPVVPAQATVMPAISIHIQIGPNGQAVTEVRNAPSAEPLSIEAQEKLEDAMDFSACAGFQEDFMGVLTPLPQPNSALRSKLAFLLQSPAKYILKYHHYSSIHHAMRRVPVVSAINVHGKFRYAALGQGTRVDNWYRDNRIDYDVQLNDDFYKKSGFDKGHLSRREDAEWGTNINKAKVAADMTCSYANAVPQVPAFNRNIFGFHGLWGQLENKLLEEGPENETSKSAKICVFNGPLFSPNDPAFKGVQVALNFFKVVVWYDGTGKLRTTCFKLTQKDNVGQIDFEVLHFDDVFKTFQVPISQIETATGLAFHANIKGNDTSTGGDNPIDGGGLERLLKEFRNE